MTTQPTPRAARPQIEPLWYTAPFLLPYLVYVLHTLEELPGFASWASTTAEITIAVAVGTVIAALAIGFLFV